MAQLQTLATKALEDKVSTLKRGDQDLTSRIVVMEDLLPGLFVESRLQHCDGEPTFAGAGHSSVPFAIGDHVLLFGLRSLVLNGATGYIVSVGWGATCWSSS